MSPTASYYPTAGRVGAVAALALGRGVPGVVGTGWVAGRGYTGYYPPSHPPCGRMSLLALGPYLRPNEGNSEVDENKPQIDLRIDLRIDPD